MVKFSISVVFWLVLVTVVLDDRPIFEPQPWPFFHFFLHRTPDFDRNDSNKTRPSLPSPLDFLHNYVLPVRCQLDVTSLFDLLQSGILFLSELLLTALHTPFRISIKRALRQEFCYFLKANCNIVL